MEHLWPTLQHIQFSVSIHNKIRAPRRLFKDNRVLKFELFLNVSVLASNLNCTAAATNNPASMFATGYAEMYYSFGNTAVCMCVYLLTVWFCFLPLLSSSTESAALFMRLSLLPFPPSSPCSGLLWSAESVERCGNKLYVLPFVRPRGLQRPRAVATSDHATSPAHRLAVTSEDSGRHSATGACSGQCRNRLEKSALITPVLSFFVFFYQLLHPELLFVES